LLKPSGMQAFFPLWKRPTKDLINGFIASGFKTLLCAADAKYFSADRVGKTVDTELISAMPHGVDPCGENGEFHTFVFDGPVFKQPIILHHGEVVKKTYHFQRTNAEGEAERIESAFWFQDLF
jgi:diphthamide synthase (EF-2-diphthine--ammonia ligase)